MVCVVWCYVLRCYQRYQVFFVLGFPIWDCGGNTFDAAQNPIVCEGLVFGRNGAYCAGVGSLGVVL